MRYDASVAAPEGQVFTGNLLGNSAFSANTAQSGVVLGGFAGTQGVNGTGTLAWVPFRAVGQPGERTPLSVNVTTINDPSGTALQIERVDGHFRVQHLQDAQASVEKLRGERGR